LKSSAKSDRRLAVTEGVRTDSVRHGPSRAGPAIGDPEGLLAPPDRDGAPPFQGRCPWVVFAQRREKVFAHDQGHAQLFPNLEQPARHVDAVARRRDVLMVARAEPRHDDVAVMRADPQIDALAPAIRLLGQPLPDPRHQPGGGRERVVGVRRPWVREPEDAHRTITHEAHHHAAVAADLVLHQGVELLEENLRRGRSEALAELGETGQVHKDDGQFLRDRLGEERGIERQTRRQGRRLKAPKRLLGAGEALGEPPVEDLPAHDPEGDRQRHRGEGQGGAHPKISAERERRDDDPGGACQRDESDTERGRRQGQQESGRHRENDRGRRIDASHRHVAHQAIAGEEMADRGGQHLDTGQNGVVGRREGVAGADRRRADHRNLAPQGIGPRLAAQDGAGAQCRDGAARAVEAKRQVQAEIRARLDCSDDHCARPHDRLGAGCPRRDPKRQGGRQRVT
jgi:hypothetical protein